VIPNHVAAKLSACDLAMAECVPPGGNWKDIPESIPSQRLAQIRTSFAAGKGSRSTYYGRLMPNKPAYTISTYFGRPGNGCHLHYDYAGGQHRTISQREAARFQTFPDSFVFAGAQGPVSVQIGNAVPPLMAYRLARSFPTIGSFVDLFCGAGGSALGFHFAGWRAAVSNDVDGNSLETHRLNLASPAVLGDIRSEAVFDEVVGLAMEAFRQQDEPRLVVGGPPCQGFSTAGNRRSMDDERNHLFQQYTAMLRRLTPDYFVFENVTGILNMEGGRIFDMVMTTLAEAGYSLAYSTIRAEQHGIPQRRARVIILGTRNGVAEQPAWPQVITYMDGPATLFNCPSPPSATDAIGDLPPLLHGKDGSSLDYIAEPSSSFQRYARGISNAEDYLREISTIAIDP
jgi:DNA (cytosine-5)-methyltransferase 1